MLSQGVVMKVSKKLIDKVKLSSLRAYEIAWKADIHEATLSHLMNNIRPVEKNDKRVLAVATVVGVEAEDCFE